MGTRKIETGWCQNGTHEKCPELMQAHRTTPNGKTLREIHCCCGCHSDKRLASDPRWQEQRLPLCEE